MDSSIPRFMLVGILLMLSAIFSSAETSLTTANRIKLKTMADDGDKKAIKILKTTEDPSKMISAILIGNNIVNISASAVATVTAVELYGDAMVGIFTSILTLLVIFFGEIIPKKAATKYSVTLARIYVTPISWLMKVLAPVIFIIDKATSFMKDNGEGNLTEEDIKAVMDIGREDGAIEETEHKVITNVFEFGEKTAKDIMVPKSEIASIDAAWSLDKIIDNFKAEKYTRLVVNENGKPIGILNIKDIAFADEENFDVKNYLRKPYTTYEFKKLADLLPIMKKNTNNVALIVDEYGELSGLLTMEDLLEELVGEIEDEFDNEELQNNESNKYEVNGAMKIDDLNKQLNINIEKKQCDSIGGLVIESLDKMPCKNDSININGTNIKIIEMEGAKITKVQILINATQV